jgi:hypothetical protein
LRQFLQAGLQCIARRRELCVVGLGVAVDLLQVLPRRRQREKKKG